MYDTTAKTILSEPELGLSTTSRQASVSFDDITFGITTYCIGWGPPDAPMLMLVSTNDFRPIVITRYSLNPTTRTNMTFYLPKLNSTEAITEGERYLRLMGLTVSTNWTIAEVTYGQLGIKCWCISWEPVIGGQTFDKFGRLDGQYVTVSFVEDAGFRSYSDKYCFPSPTNYPVRIARTDAIKKAGVVAPFVLKTPLFQQTRWDILAIGGVLSAELTIYAPNWLLDPKRAIVVRKGVPRETRVCWVVTFETWAPSKYSQFDAADTKVLIYIDACTGETVGANFS